MKKPKPPKGRSPIAQHLRRKGHGIEGDKRKQEMKLACRKKLKRS